MVPLYLSMSLAHSSVSRRNSIGVTLTNSTPKYIGTVKNPVIPMSWNSGSQHTITSVSTSTWAPVNIASALDTKFLWVIWTAFGDPVDPDVNCSSARSSSSVSTGSIGAPSNKSSMVSTRMPSSDSSGAAGMKGSEMMTALASIMLMTAVVSSAQRCRSVRGGSDLDGGAGQHGDRVTGSDAGRGQAAGDAAGALVHLTPCVPDRGVGLAGDHALGAGHRVGIHRLGEAAHD